MTASIEQLEARLAELKGQRTALEATMTKEDLARNVEQWLETARAQAAGSSRLVLGGQASGVHLAQVLAEDALDDEGLAGRIVARLERQGFGELSDRQRNQRRAKLVSAIAEAEQELREAAKAEAIAAVERQYAGEAA
jgi:hypothetical protein